MQTLTETGDRKISRSNFDGAPGACNFRTLLRTAALLLIVCGEFSIAQSFSVRNPKQLKFPDAEANRIYRSAADAIQQEFQQSEPLRPEFTLVLGAEHNQLDVEAKELRLVKWDQNLFARGVVLFSFEQLMPEQRSTRLAQRAVSEARATVNTEEARTAAYAPQPAPAAVNPAASLKPEPHPVLRPR